MIPDSSREQKEKIECLKNMRRLRLLIINGKLSPASLNGRVTTSCPHGGKYIFSEGILGPEIKCIKHSIKF
jgi:hypothetical protein